MSKALEWIGKILGGLLGLLAVAVALVYWTTTRQLNRTYDVEVKVDVPVAAASVERGRHLVTTLGFCRDCHGDNLAGQILDDDPLVGRLVATNLTPGKGGVSRTLSDEDLVRAIRHGIGRDGKPLIAMPSNYYYSLSDSDLASIIAYLKSVPPVDNELPDSWAGPLGRLYLLMEPPLLAASEIDHAATRPPAPTPGVTAEYGEYLAFSCKVCHGADLAGRPGAGGGLNLTPGGELAGWIEEDFIHAIRTGVTPTGKQLNSEDMPWRTIGQLTDDELRAIWLYLRSLPPVDVEAGSGTREN